jgi:hypothetical protein
VRGEHLPELEQALGRLQGVVDRTKASGLAGVEHRQVIHDRIDQHFKHVHLDAYRRLSGLRIDTLSRVNLFAGANNSGKTTLLEAVFVLTRQNDFDGVLEVIRRRGKVPKDQLDPQWLLEQLVGEVRINGVFDGQETEVSARVRDENDATLDRSRYLGSVELTSAFGSDGHDSLTRLYKGPRPGDPSRCDPLALPRGLQQPVLPQRAASLYPFLSQERSIQIAADDPGIHQRASPGDAERHPARG